MKNLFRLMGILVLMAAVGCGATGKATSADISAGETRMQRLLEDADVQPENVEIAIYKEDRRLELWADGVLLQEYSIALGGSQRGDKSVEGDERTPEGEYWIAERHRSKFHLFLGLNYPNADDAMRGLEAGLIDEATYAELVAANEAGQKPSWSTAMGGAIGIHGGGAFFDWTAGCIAVSNSAIEEIWAVARPGTPVTIHP